MPNALGIAMTADLDSYTDDRPLALVEYQPDTELMYQFAPDTSV